MIISCLNVIKHFNTLQSIIEAMKQVLFSIASIAATAIRICFPYLGVQAEGELGDATGDFVEMNRFGSTISLYNVHAHFECFS